METTRVISATECNPKSELSLPALIGIVQDAVTVTLEEYGSDNLTLRKDYGAMWVFVKHKIRVFRAPKWNERIEVSCNSVKTTRITNYMMTELRAGNELIAVSLLECCVLDTEDFRIKKLCEIPPIPVCEREADFSFALEEAEYCKAYPFSVTPFMLDSSMHLNNVQSAGLIWHFLTQEEAEKLYAPAYEFTVHYKNQAHCGEKLQMKKSRVESGCAFAIEKSDGTPVITAQIKL